MADVDQINKRAEESFNKRNYDYARDLFMQSLLVKPNQDHPRRGLKATILTKFKEQGAPSKLSLMTGKASVAAQIGMNKNKPDKLVDICQKHLLIDPTNSGVRGILAQALYDLHHVLGAATEAEMAVMDDPKNLTAAKCLVQCYKDMEKIKEAQEVLAKVERIAPDDRDIMRLQRDLAARETMKKGFEDTKEKGMKAALKDAGKSVELEKAQHLIKTDADVAALIAKVEEEMAENPTDPKPVKKLGDVYFEIKKDYTSARKWYEIASKLAPQDSLLRDKVDDCMIKMYDVQIEHGKKTNDAGLDDAKKARLQFIVQSFERRVMDRPTDMSLRFQLGKAYFTGTLLDKAITEFQQSVKDPKQKVDSHLYLGMAFHRKRIHDMADVQFQKAEEAGILDSRKKLETWYMRAMNLADAKNYPKAVEFGKMIMEEDISFKDISARVERWSQGQP